jgi:transcriptional regulator with XRE-family HTH domain
MATRKTHGPAIRAMRELIGLQQAALAAAVGVEPPTLSNIEAGRKNGSPQVVARIAARLGVTLDAITVPDGDEQDLQHYTAEQVAQFTGWTTDAILRAARAKEIPSRKFGKTAPRFHADDIRVISRMALQGPDTAHLIAPIANPADITPSRARRTATRRTA